MLTATEGKSKSAVHTTRTVELSGPLSKLLTRSASRHGGYGWVRDLPDSRDFLYAAPLLLFRSRFAHQGGPAPQMPARL